MYLYILYFTSIDWCWWLNCLVSTGAKELQIKQFAPINFVFTLIAVVAEEINRLVDDCATGRCS
jgi:hypothetical protein